MVHFKNFDGVFLVTGGVCGALPSCSGGEFVCVAPHSGEVSVHRGTYAGGERGAFRGFCCAAGMAE